MLDSRVVHLTNTINEGIKDNYDRDAWMINILIDIAISLAVLADDCLGYNEKKEDEH